jgi:hypothetical protein
VVVAGARWKNLEAGFFLRNWEDGGMKWILELEASEFPGVMEKLADLESFADPILGDHKPFVNQDTVPFVKYGFARWYELEGELAVEWMLADRAFP